MQIETFTDKQACDPHWLHSSLESQTWYRRKQWLADSGWAPMWPGDDPDAVTAGKMLSLSALAGCFTLLLEASRTSRTMPFPSHNNPTAFPAISEASGSMPGLAAVVLMLLLIGLSYMAGKVRHHRLNSKSSARVPHAPAHPPPNRASA